MLAHFIQLTDYTPIRQRSYCIQESLAALQRKESTVMKDMGVIELSTNAWRSPIVLVPKKDEYLILCMDFRKLNTVS